MTFVDTSAWFAYFFPRDPNHQRIRQILISPQRRLITTDYCVDETLTLLVARGETRRAIDAGRAFFEVSIARLHFVTRNQIERAWLLFRQRVSAAWSFTDCASKEVMDDLKISTAAALDQHFYQFGGVNVVP